MSKILVTNLPESATRESLHALFARHGTVEEVTMLSDRDTGLPRGVAIVTMSAREAARAIQNLNGHDMDGHALCVGETEDEHARARFRQRP